MNSKKVPNSRRRLQNIVILRSKSATKKLVLFCYFLKVELCKGLNLDKFKEAFEKIFVVTGYKEHYKKMME